MKFIVLTIFPNMFDHFWEFGIVGRAIKEHIISASAINIRDFASGKHRTTDDRPYGGGTGMVMKPEPLAEAIQFARKSLPEGMVVLLSPQGRVFNQEMAEQLARVSGLILVCGRYEGVDERICESLVDMEISIGDYILTGGEPAGMVLMDAVTRLMPGALGGDDSAQKESFSNGLLEHAHFTRPRAYQESQIPEVLFSGNHRRIEEWRMESALIRTFLKRKDLLEARTLSTEEVEILKKWSRDLEKIIDAQAKPETTT
ncbi:MAG: tRNA (guanosine(37)-N1)-methyltransferase TrmD [Thermodesulfobacteriota bacterium]